MRDSEGDQHVFSSTPGTCLCDGQPGSHATLAIPDLDMVDTRPADTQQEEEEEAPPLVLPFSHPRCDDPSLTGGKGASLGGIHLFILCRHYIFNKYIYIFFYVQENCQNMKMFPSPEDSASRHASLISLWTRSSECIYWNFRELCSDKIQIKRIWKVIALLSSKK